MGEHLKLNKTIYICLLYVCVYIYILLMVVDLILFLKEWIYIVLEVFPPRNGSKKCVVTCRFVVWIKFEQKIYFFFIKTMEKMG